MDIRKRVLNKILEESKKYEYSEFGGMLEIKRDHDIVDIHFPEYDIQTGGYIKFNMNDIMDLPEDIQSNIKGWFHRHPINFLSKDDIDTVKALTKFWGRCFTLVWLSNGNLKLWKTRLVRGINTKVVEVYDIQEIEFKEWLPNQEVVEVGYTK